MSVPTSVLLFAAGLGTRMAPLTDTRPKPMVNVAGRPLLDYALEHCDNLRAVVNVHYLAGQIRAHLGATGVAISDETDLLRETGGGLKHALALLGSNPVVTMNTDAVWKGQNPIQLTISAWQPDKMESLLVMIPRLSAVGHTGSGDFDIDTDGRLTRGADFVYSGVQIIRTDRLQDIPKDVFSMWDLWDGMLERRTMFGVPYDGAWCDVGRPESILLAETMLAGGSHV